jgi:uncharacterized membrane protein YccC
MCVQSLIASALTYACMRFIGSSSITWGVFSSLFALQVSFDRSLKYGVGQMIGAAIGTAVGLATLHVFPDAADALPRLGLATLVTCLVSTLFPTTNYSIVVAAALALEPSAGVAGAVSRAEAIALSAAIGIGVSLSVWPQLSRSRAFDIMDELLEDCRALLATMPIRGPLDNLERVDALHERFLRHLVEARAVCGETRVRARFETGSSLGAALVAFETVCHGLVLLDRIGQSQCGCLTDEERERLAERIGQVRDCASDYLQALATWMRGGAPLPRSHRFLEPMNDASTAIRSDISDVILECAADSRQLQALSTLSFALEQIEANLASIAGALETRSDRPA